MCHLGWGQTEAPYSMTQLWSFQSMCPASGGAACVSTSSTKSMFKYLEQASDRCKKLCSHWDGSKIANHVSWDISKKLAYAGFLSIKTRQEWHCRILCLVLCIQGTDSSELAARKGYFWHQQSQLPPLQYPMQRKWWNQLIQIIFRSYSRTCKQSRTTLLLASAKVAKAQVRAGKYRKPCRTLPNLSSTE